MQFFVFNRFPTWLLGAYGGVARGVSATPTIDRIAAAGVVFDNVYVTADKGQTRERSGILNQPAIHVESLTTTAPSRSDSRIGAAIDDWLSETSWARLVDFWRDEFGHDDGFEIPATLTPQSLLANEDDDLFSSLFHEDLLFECNEAAEFLNAVEYAEAAAADSRLKTLLDQSDDAEVVITAKLGGSPSGTIHDSLLDSWRHVPLIVGSQRPTESTGSGRFRQLIAAESVLQAIAEQEVNSNQPLSVERLSADARDAIVFHSGNDTAVRTVDALFTREHREGEIRERFFAKPDDRWNQLDLASQLFDRLEHYRNLLTASSDETVL